MRNLFHYYLHPCGCVIDYWCCKEVITIDLLLEIFLTTLSRANTIPTALTMQRGYLLSSTHIRSFYIMRSMGGLSWVPSHAKVGHFPSFPGWLWTLCTLSRRYVMPQNPLQGHDNHFTPQTRRLKVKTTQIFIL